MCGIAFVINYGDKPMPLDCIEYIFKNMEARGDDASGIYYERTTKDSACSRVFKGPFTATDLWNNVQEDVEKLGVPVEYKKRWQMTGQERLIMMHTRSATKGTIANNYNNMPIFGRKWVLIHNGMVNGPRLKDYKYKGEVDSEDLLAHLETTNDIQKSIGAMTGSMAICARPLLEDHLFLYRNSNPLSLIIAEKSRILFGCSKPEYVIDEEMIELLDDDPFAGGKTTIDITPNVVYKVGLNAPTIEALSVQRPISGDWKQIKETETWDYTHPWSRQYDGMED